ncbi:MAG: tannase/feruloyl esterase family alpha/beta hydrolase [Bryobacterales bacterium]|nr:tannase/feruloyl esterase family alpha/beta hydrolase [Bryobacterales bacterium]
MFVPFTRAVLFLAVGMVPIRAATCESLTSLKFPDATIALAQTVEAGAFTPPGAADPIKNVPAFCRVTGVMRPSPDSDIRFEVWMPASGWNGKFQGVGNGGFAGSISYGGMAAPLARGYATASTDTGHSGGDASWALGRHEKLIDYGYRGIHEMTVKAKAIVEAFYGKAPSKSYFASCSNGGRQALMEAQRYPGDYDGIISGAPANAFTLIGIGFVWNEQALLKDPASYIPPAKLKTIESAVLAACDARDGAADGLLEDPRQCHFDAGTLLCKGEDSGDCLTAPQVETLRKIYEGPKDPKGKSIFPGFVPGGETGRGGWGAWINSAEPDKSLQYFFGTQMFKNMVFENPSWDFRTMNYDKDVALIQKKLAPILNSTDANLKPFDARGGKLILYHGWCDAALTPLNTINYYKEVVAKVGAKKAARFVRLYMAPGMQHCGGGPGPDPFWGRGAGKADARNDLTLALERWVEDGVAPTTITASKLEGGKVVRTRPLCPYPQVARYKGSGSLDEAESFGCIASGAPRAK